MERRRRRKHMRRRLLTGVVAAMIGAAGCGAGDDLSQSPAADGATTATEDRLLATSHAEFAGLAFDHPTAWTAQPFAVSSSFSDLITYLSAVPLHDPCTRTSAPNGTETACNQPVGELAADSILVAWANVGYPLAPGRPDVGSPNTTIGG